MARSGYRPLVLQSLHYLARPQQQVLREPLRGAAAWRADELTDGSWREALLPDEVAELERALAVAHATGRPTAELRREDFPLPSLGARIDGWRRTLASGRGFVVVGGVPVQRWSERDCETFFWCLGLHLGIPGAQNPQGELLGHVRDTGVAPGARVRQYRTNEAIDFHCDLADVVGLLCLRAAKEGGDSRIASSVTVYNELLRRHPDVVDALYEPFQLDTRGDGGLTIIPVAPCRYAAGQLRTFYHGGYFRSAPERRGGRPLTAAETRALDAYADVLASEGLALSMEFRPGDIQLLSNHTIVHAREGFVDHEDLAERRHLLRLWLSLDERRPLTWRLRKERDRLSVLRRAARRWAATAVTRLRPGRA